MSQLTHCFDKIDDNLSLYGLRQLFQLNEGPMSNAGQASK
jgi:hypothetical protein